MSDQLREAFYRWEVATPETIDGVSGVFIAPLTLDDALTIFNAARAYEQGTTRRWCETHNSVETNGVYLEGQLICQYAWYSGHTVEPCRIVEVRVSPLAEGME